MYTGNNAIKIWFDALTPKHILLAYALRNFLNQQAFPFKLYLTSRPYDYNIKMLDKLMLEGYICGGHGKTLSEKLEIFFTRGIELYRLISKVDPNLLISFSSPEAVRIAFGLKIPAITLNDSPHSKAVARLTFSLSDYVIIPEAFPLRMALRLGMPKYGFIAYHGVDEVAWIKHVFLRKEQVRRKNVKENGSITIVFRPEEHEASYYPKGRVLDYIRILKVLDEFSRKYKVKMKIYVLPRYENQLTHLKKISIKLKNIEIIIPETRALILAEFIVKESPNLIITGGATMAREAALLGIPSICYFPHVIYVNEWLRKQGYPLFHVRTLSEFNRVLEDIVLGGLKKYFNVIVKTLQFEDPIETLFLLLSQYT